MFTISKKALFSTIVFTLIGLALMQIPVTKLAGSSAQFTAFDCFGPLAGSFLSTIPGIISVLAMQVANLFIHGRAALDFGTFIRLFPMLFAVLYFSKKTTLNVIIPALAIIAFLANPVGRTVWYFTLFWTIPLLCTLWKEKSLIARSLGSTFAAHAVGGALWIWYFHLPAATWNALIPVVIVERLLFTAGIALMYVVMNYLLTLLSRTKAPVSFTTSAEYLWNKTV